MGIFLLLCSSVFHQMESMFVKNYKKKYGDGGLLFNALMSLFALVYFVLSERGGFYFPTNLWLHGIIGGAMYATGFYSVFVAFGCGSFALTSLILSFTSIFSVGFGIFYLKEQAGPITYLAIIICFVSLFLMNYKKGDESEENAVTKKWILCMFFAVFSNGMLGVLSRLQQIRFENQCTNEYYIISLSISFMVLLIAGIVKERHNLSDISRTGIFTGAIAGMLNGAKNFLNTQSYLYIPIMIATPLGSGMKIVLTFMISFFIYKERFSKQQLVGAGLSAVAIILLGIG